jgi:anti-sigma factor RsiW
MNHLTDTQLNDFLDNLLPPSEHTQVKSHLASCPACREQLLALEHVFSLLSSLGEQPLPNDLSARVLAQIPLSRALTRTERLWLAGAVGAALGALASIAQALLPQVNVSASPETWFSQAFVQWAGIILSVKLPQIDFPSSLPWSDETLAIMAVAATILWVLGNASLLRERLRVGR